MRGGGLGQLERWGVEGVEGSEEGWRGGVERSGGGGEGGWYLGAAGGVLGGAAGDELGVAVLEQVFV